MTTQTYCGAYGRTEDQELFKRTVHAFVEREIVPTAHDCDEREAFPWPNVRKMSEIGLLGLVVPEEYGGAGTNALDYVLAVEEVAVTATRVSTRWRSCSATPRSPRSTRAPARSSAWSSPATAPMKVSVTGPYAQYRGPATSPMERN